MDLINGCSFINQAKTGTAVRTEHFILQTWRNFVSAFCVFIDSAVLPIGQGGLVPRAQRQNGAQRPD